MLFKKILATHIALQINWTFDQESPSDLKLMESIFIYMIPSVASSDFRVCCSWCVSYLHSTTNGRSNQTQRPTPCWLSNSGWCLSVAWWSVYILLIDECGTKANRAHVLHVVMTLWPKRYVQRKGRQPALGWLSTSFNRWHVCLCWFCLYFTTHDDGKPPSVEIVKMKEAIHEASSGS